MTFLPIVERELRVAARLPATFRNRAITAGVVAVAGFIMLAFSSLTGSASLLGRNGFFVLACGTLCYCLLEGVRKTADCISEEKRDGTLGLLFLTDLRGYDVVLGKLAATSLNSFYGLLAILPVLALPLLVGGVTPGEYWRVVLALLNILFFSLCTGLAVSSSSTRQQQAIGATAAAIVLICALPLLTFSRVFYPLSPVYGFHTAFAASYGGGNSGYLRSFGLTQLWSWTMLVCASLAAPRSWQETEARPQWAKVRRRRWFNGRPGRSESREQMLARNPVLWLAARGQGRTPALNLLVIITIIGTMAFIANAGPDLLDTYLVCALILNFIVKILLAEQSTRFFAEARRENELEMLLGTPLTKEQIINGQILALKRLFLVPVATILMAEFVGGLMVFGFTQYQHYSSQAADELFEFMVCMLICLAIFCSDVAALIWGGMYFGLTVKKPSQAATKTVLFVLVMPLAGIIPLVFCFGWLFFIATPIFWMTWGKMKVETHLRGLAGDRYALNPVDPYRRTGLAPPRIVPPIINQTPSGRQT